jgi:hypothetical protein
MTNFLFFAQQDSYNISHMYLQELQDFRDKYKQQSRELKEALAKQKITIEQYTDTNDT